jgi:hypothetical protein
LNPNVRFERLRALSLQGAYACASQRDGSVVELSDFFEIAATLIVGAAVIWLPGAIFIKATDHLRSRRDGRQRLVGVDRLAVDRLGETR